MRSHPLTNSLPHQRPADVERRRRSGLVQQRVEHELLSRCDRGLSPQGARR